MTGKSIPSKPVVQLGVLLHAASYVCYHCIEAQSLQIVNIIGRLV